MEEEKFDVVILGAGCAGLIAAATYLKLVPDINILIVDKGASIGDAWRKERIYPNLFTQDGHGVFEYSFYQMKERLTADRYMSGQTMHAYLNDFAHEYDLARRIRLQVQVIKIEHLDGSGWRLHCHEGSKIRGEKLIYASGVSPDSYTPSISNEGFTKPLIHSSQINSSLEAIKGHGTKRVTVVGAAKSSYDTVHLLLHAGKSVDWIIPEEGAGPLATMPPHLIGGINTVDIMATRAFAAFSPAIGNTRGWWYRFLHLTRVGRAVTRFVWRWINCAAEQHAGHSKNANALKLISESHGEGIFWANAGLGVSSMPNFWKLFHAGDCTIHRTDISQLRDEKCIMLTNGVKIECDYLIFCTDWTADRIFEESLRAKIGLPSQANFSKEWQRMENIGEENINRMLPILISPPDPLQRTFERRPSRLYRRLISPNLTIRGDRSLFFPGQISSLYTQLVAEVQALWGIAFMLGMIDVPDKEDMEIEIATWNAWTKKRYLEQGYDSGYSIYDHLAYIDTLCRDLGIKTRRKSNPISEMFAPYRPSDYAGLIEEFLQGQRKKYVSKDSGDEDEESIIPSY